METIQIKAKDVLPGDVLILSFGEYTIKDISITARKVQWRMAGLGTGPTGFWSEGVPPNQEFSVRREVVLV